MGISLVATILNEGQVIAALLDSLLAQTCPPDEIILVDGGSQDDTLALIETYQTRLPLRILQEAGCNISRGRNLGIQASQQEIIAVTDAGVRIPPHWLEALTAPLVNDPQVQVVAGFFHPDADPHSSFEIAMSATVLPLEAEIQPESFLPSSRSVAFRKPVWAAVGGYPEWLDYCEDLIFDLRLKAEVGNFHFAPQAYVYFKPRTSLRAFFKQYYLYARGDGKADLWRKRHAARYITYLVLLPIIGWLSAFLHPAFGLLLIAGGWVYLRQAYRRLLLLSQPLTLWQKGLAYLYVPIIRVVGDIAKMVGYPVGLLWRWQTHPPAWK